MNIIGIVIVLVLAIICIYLEIKSPRCSRGEVCRMIASGVIGILLLSELVWCEILGVICMVPYTILTLFALWPKIFDK